MEWKYSVIEHRAKTSGIILLNQETKNSAITKPVWNILYSVPYNPVLEDEATAFDACLVWLEQNRVDGSEYIITELFFV